MQVYLPMSYMYGKRGVCKETSLTAAIRGELYTQSYSSIDWNAARNQCASEDLYYPHPKVTPFFNPEPPFSLLARSASNGSVTTE